MQRNNIHFMTKASKTVYYFGFYLIVLGLILVFVPNILLTLFDLESTSEVWIHVVGSLVFALGTYYVFIAKADHESLLKATVFNRLLIFAWFILFVILGWVGWQLILFGGIDLLGAIWTWNAMQKAQKS